jgi:PAS domain S-box-containing protein
MISSSATTKWSKIDEVLIPGEEVFRVLIDGRKTFSIFTTDSHGNLLSWNHGALRIFGYQRSEVLGKSAAILFTPESWCGIAALLRDVNLVKEEWASTVRHHVRNNGSTFIANTVITRVAGEQGESFGFVTLVTDAVSKLPDPVSLSELYNLTDAMECLLEQPFLILGAADVVLSASSSFSSFFKIDRNEVIGVTLEELRSNPKTSAIFNGVVSARSRLAGPGASVPPSVLHQISNQEISTDAVYLRRFYLSGEQREITFVLFNGVQPSPTTEVTLRIPSIIVELLFKSSRDTVKFLNSEGRVIAMNNPGQVNYESEDFQEIEGCLWADLWPDKRCAERAMNSAQAGEIARFESSCPTKEGILKEWNVTVYPIRDRSGLVTRLLTVSKEISTKKAIPEQEAPAFSAPLPSTV